MSTKVNLNIKNNDDPYILCIVCHKNDVEYVFEAHTTLTQLSIGLHYDCFTGWKAEEK